MGKRWTDADIKKLQASGAIITETITSSKPLPKELQQALSPDPHGLKYIKQTMIDLDLDFVTEHRFDKVRRFRFDFAIVDKKIAVEYDGLYSEKSRHTTWEGFAEDCVKMNLAVTLGWRVLRYTPDNYRNFYKDITNLLMQQQ